MAPHERFPVGISGVREAVKAGDREALEAIRDALAQALEVAQANEAAPLAKQLVDVLGRIASLPQTSGSAVDELTQRRRARKAGSPDSSAEGGQRRTGGDRPSG